jgi:hypothetical protein
MSTAKINIEALREAYPKVSFGCFIKKTSYNRIFG